MIDESSLYWLFPILFMTHEIEEIIFLPRFVERLKWINSNKVIEKIPSISSFQFTIIVIEQLILIILLSFYCYMNNNISLYIALIIVYIVHILIHYIQAIVIKKIIPGFYMGTLSSIVLAYLLITIEVDIKELVGYILIILLIAIFNLLIMYKIISNKFKY
ncbi:HXXEE domain-containing protein [Macrococcus epidermidis]|uniref:HXXEE domain-containing protein n=1 Tax=Macrococcus epidermidis TaxID=1902580 RepID=A0A327ZYP3_9STAP|nr:HXXEE domain-containing protein [Macrococcus epidermidis]RAK46654.1 HXXEE domain-containing protein [Macrococcus epidermidis]